MTTNMDCDMEDFHTSVSLERDLGITTKAGIAIGDLKKAELARLQSLYRHHLDGHPSHSATYTFSIPEGYEKRGGMIYKSTDQAK